MLLYRLKMSDLKLFQISKNKAIIKASIEFSLEKQVQQLFESNMKELFGIDFLASEYVIGTKYGGRIDSLGIDENMSPVIFEYKLDSKENVINQGLFYLDWLMDHKADFEMLCISKLGNKVDVDWSNPRLLCIAKDFTKYDDYAIDQINRNISLIRYKYFEDDYLILELAAAVSQRNSGEPVQEGKYKGIKEYHEKSPKELLLMLEEVEEYIFTLGDDVQKKELKYYYAYSRIKNFVCIEIHPNSKKIVLFLKVPMSQIAERSDKLRDVSEIGHYGTGDTEYTISTVEDIELAKELIEKSYSLS